MRSSWFFGIQQQFQPRDLIAQQQTAFLEPAQRQFVDGALLRGTVNQIIEISMLHAQLDELAMGRVQVFLHLGRHKAP
jgi:hypothetical protein